MGVAVGGAGVLVGSICAVGVAVSGTRVGAVRTGCDVGVARASVGIREQAVAARTMPIAISKDPSSFLLIAKPPSVIPFLVRLPAYYTTFRLAWQQRRSHLCSSRRWLFPSASHRSTDKAFDMLQRLVPEISVVKFSVMAALGLGRQRSVELCGCQQHPHGPFYCPT